MSRWSFSRALIRTFESALCASLLSCGTSGTVYLSQPPKPLAQMPTSVPASATPIEGMPRLPPQPIYPGLRPRPTPSPDATTDPVIRAIAGGAGASGPGVPPGESQPPSEPSSPGAQQPPRQNAVVTVEFAPGQARLTPASITALTAFADGLCADDCPLTVVGFGDECADSRLAARRARRVREELRARIPHCEVEIETSAARQTGDIGAQIIGPIRTQPAPSEN